MNDSDVVQFDKRGRAFWIVLNRPEKRNAINAELIAGIAEGYARAHGDPDIRAIVLTGAGDRAFCAGVDLQPGQGFGFDSARPNLAYADLLRQGVHATLPVVARVNGVCMAGGMGLLAMADLAVASDRATFGLPEVKVGVFPVQVLSLLQRLAPPRMVREWCLTGEPFDAATALAAGLINYAVPPERLDEKTDWLVARLADKSPTAIRRGKYAMRAMAAMAFEEALGYGENAIATLALSEDAKEGFAAFNEKRKPSWTGR